MRRLIRTPPSREDLLRRSNQKSSFSQHEGRERGLVAFTEEVSAEEQFGGLEMKRDSILMSLLTSNSIHQLVVFGVVLGDLFYIV